MDISDHQALRRTLAQQGQQRIDDWFSSEEFRKEQDKILRAERAKEKRAAGKASSSGFGPIKPRGEKRKKPSEIPQKAQALLAKKVRKTGRPSDHQLDAISQALFDQAMVEDD